MNQVSELISTLKQLLREQQITYRQLAQRLELSEASIKRLFSEQSFSLERFAQICEVAGVDIAGLTQLADERRQKVVQLTREQEKELAGDLRLLLVTNSLLNHWTFNDIIQTYRISEHECIQLMARLDRMRLIQLLPGNRVKLNVDRKFSWLAGGPIETFFARQVQGEFLNAGFSKPGELRVFINGMLSRKSNRELQDKMRALAAEFDEMHKRDASLPTNERYGSSLLLAIRPWELKAFDDLRREENTKQF